MAKALQVDILAGFRWAKSPPYMAKAHYLCQRPGVKVSTGRSGAGFSNAAFYWLDRRLR